MPSPLSLVAREHERFVVEMHDDARTKLSPFGERNASRLQVRVEFSHERRIPRLLTVVNLAGSQPAAFIHDATSVVSPFRERFAARMQITSSEASKAASLARTSFHVSGNTCGRNPYNWVRASRSCRKLSVRSLERKKLHRDSVEDVPHRLGLLGRGYAHRRTTNEPFK